MSDVILVLGYLLVACGVVVMPLLVVCCAWICRCRPHWVPKSTKPVYMCGMTVISADYWLMPDGTRSYARPAAKVETWIQGIDDRR